MNHDPTNKTQNLKINEHIQVKELTKEYKNPVLILYYT